MTVPKDIADKVKEYNRLRDQYKRLCDQAEDLGNELQRFFGPHMEDCFDIDFFYAEEAEGDPQGDGEFCDQAGNCDEGYSGNYYYPAEGGGFVGVGYCIF